MKQERNILSGVSRSVAAAVLTVVVLFSLIPAGLRADERFVIDPTGKREGLAAFLYDNKTGFRLLKLMPLRLLLMVLYG